MALRTLINSDKQTQYGSAANGREVGNGYDVEIKRASPNSAIVNVMTPNGSDDWLTLVDVEPTTNLQALAVEIGRCPDFGNGGYVHADQASRWEWEEIAEQWDAIEVK